MAYPHFPRESCPALYRRLGRAARRCAAAAMGRLPTDCPLCQGAARAGGLCAGCLHDITASMRGGGRRCALCALPLGTLRACPDCALCRPAFDRVIAAFDYLELASLLIRQFKTGKRFAHARMLSGILARQVAQSAPGFSRHTIVVAVPSGSASLRRRGFNPAAETARLLARRMGLEYRPGVLLRVRQGGRQTHLPRSRRVLNTRGMYRCRGQVAGRDVALVDDVLTTGSTAHGIAGQLKAAGAASVSVLVLARTPYRARP